MMACEHIERGSGSVCAHSNLLSLCLPFMTHSLSRQRRCDIRAMTYFLLYVAAQRIKVNVFRSQTVAAMFAIHPATSLRLSYENPIRRSIAGATEAARVHQSLQQKRPIAIAQFPVTGKLPCALRSEER